jgi:hypothetical protein
MNRNEVGDRSRHRGNTMRAIRNVATTATRVLLEEGRI